MNADITPMNADEIRVAMGCWLMNASIPPTFERRRFPSMILNLSAFIGVISAFIGDSKDLRPHHSPAA